MRKRQTWPGREFVMSAQQRAARAAAEIQRSRAIASAARGVQLMELGVRVQGTDVHVGRGLRSLKGACAGVMDLKAPGAGAFISSVVIGNVPRVGTIFVAFADGTRHEKPLLQGSRAQIQKVDEAIRLFNTMADAAEEIERERARHLEAKSSRLTYHESKPGREAYKAARRAGMSREEASKASQDALAPLKEAKRAQNRRGQA
jgi:hypothetical protein